MNRYHSYSYTQRGRGGGILQRTKQGLSMCYPMHTLCWTFSLSWCMRDSNSSRRLSSASFQIFSSNSILSSCSSSSSLSLLTACTCCLSSARRSLCSAASLYTHAHTCRQQGWREQSERERVREREKDSIIVSVATRKIRCTYI